MSGEPQRARGESANRTAEPSRRDDRYSRWGIKRSPVSAQVADTLRNMILVGELQPGEIVTQARLAEMLGVSPMPVREALLRLSHEGFIEAQASKPFRVAWTTREDVQDIYRAQAMISGELARLAVERGGTDLVDELEAIESRWTTADARDLDELNTRFHRAINHAARSPKLLVLLRTTVSFIPDRFYSLLPEWRALSQAGHHAIVEAIRARDADAARNAAADHVLDAGNLLIAHFSEMGYWKEPPPA